MGLNFYLTRSALDIFVELVPSLDLSPPRTSTWTRPSAPASSSDNPDSAVEAAKHHRRQAIDLWQMPCTAAITLHGAIFSPENRPIGRF